MRFLQLDVFTERAGGGNPLGVVVGADAWDAAEMQRFAAWTDLVETTFVLAPTAAEASYRVRIFTPSKEIPFAGHPSVGTAHAVLECGLAQPRDGRLVQECAAGLLPVDVEPGARQRRLSVQAPPARVEPDDPAARARLAPLLDGLAPGALPPALVAGGRRWWVVELAEEAALRAWRPDHAAIAALAQATDTLGVCVFARAAESDYDLAVRAFPAGAGIVEDPASGAANGLIAAYIAGAEPDGPLARGYRVSQGREIGRDARMELRMDAGVVRVGGAVQTVLDARLHWAAARA
nr:PhzF family phenazine biosynthesis protein [Coralloluteibacterium stylophorae]